MTLTMNAQINTGIDSIEIQPIEVVFGKYKQIWLQKEKGAL